MIAGRQSEKNATAQVFHGKQLSRSNKLSPSWEATSSEGRLTTEDVIAIEQRFDNMIKTHHLITRRLEIVVVLLVLWSASQDA